MNDLSAVHALLATFAFRGRLTTILDKAKQEFELEGTEIVTLLLLTNGSANIQTIVRAVALHQNGVSILVERLRARGLVERRRDRADRRVANVKLSKAGRDVSGRLQQYLDQPLETLLSPLSGEERLQLVTLFEQLARAPSTT